MAERGRKPNASRTEMKVLYDKIYDFHRRGVLRELGGRSARLPTVDVKGRVNPTFTPKDLVSKNGSKCYLTGRDIDFEVGTSYQLDHIIPNSFEGNSILENCGIACKQANYAKGDMTLEEFFQLCIEVVKHNKLL